MAYTEDEERTGATEKERVEKSECTEIQEEISRL